MILEYCRKCGSELEERNSEGRTRKYCPECEEFRYKSPKPSAGVVLVEEEEALIIRRGIEPNKGSWSIPAGFVEHDEPPVEAAIRELQEETGIRIERSDVQLENVIQVEHPSDYIIPIIYSARITDIEERLNPNEEVQQARTVTLSQLQDLKPEFETPELYEVVKTRLENSRS